MLLQRALVATIEHGGYRSDDAWKVCDDDTVVAVPSASSTGSTDADDDSADEADDEELYIDSLSDYEDDTLARQSSLTDLHQTLDWSALGLDGRGAHSKRPSEYGPGVGVHYIDDFSDYETEDKPGSDNKESRFSITRLDAWDWTKVSSFLRR